MKRSKFTEAQVCAILKQAEGGLTVDAICREHGISSATFYKWRARYGGMDSSLIKEMRDLKEENARLKRMYADAQMDREVLKEALSKKW